eukprot:1343311-Rhodomonas_salina.3
MRRDPHLTTTKPDDTSSARAPGTHHSMHLSRAEDQNRAHDGVLLVESVEEAQDLTTGALPTSLRE